MHRRHQLGAALCLAFATAPALAQSGPAPLISGQYPWNYQGSAPRDEQPARIAGACPISTPTPRVLIAGDSWAQFMWDDNTHNVIFDRFGHADKRAVSRSRGTNPGAGYSGPEYAISGSEAREWANPASYPWTANVVAELQALPTIDTVMLSIGGNDILAGRSGGGWYKGMDLDVPGSEAALFARILDHSAQITTSIKAVRPQVNVLVSSYEYPNFTVSPFFCWIYACPKREDLSRDPVNALVSDSELNAMTMSVETLRIARTNADPRLAFDHGVGEMHHYSGDGVAAPGALPRPGQLAPDYLPFPAGNPARPSLRSNFRISSGISADPIHLDPAGYLIKVAVQAESYFFPRFRGAVAQTLRSQGGNHDGWTDGQSVGTAEVRIGDDGSRLVYGIVSFDTSGIPAGAQIESASLYLLQQSRSGANPLVSGQLGTPRLDIAAQFGAAAVEPGDATAAADANNVGCFVGAANTEFDALRIDIGPAGLAALSRTGTTQFRIAFSTTDPGVNQLYFNDGDAVLSADGGVRQTIETVESRAADGSIQTRTVLGSERIHRGLADALGSAKPMLDIRFTSSEFADGFEAL